MSKPTVISLGEILWDMLPTGKRAGGAPVNFAYHASQNGAEGYAISAVGNDELGAELIADAHKAGINTLVQTNEYPTGTVDVALTNGIPEYTIVKNVAWDHIKLTDELIDAVSKADAVCFGTLGLRSPESHDTIIELLKHTKEGALKFFDINLRSDFYSKELIEELLEEEAPDETAQICRELKKRHYAADLEKKEEQRIFAALLRKGYSYGAIRDAICTFTCDNS